MKNLTLVIVSFFSILLFTSFGNQADKTFSLTINVEKLRNSKGIVQFALYNKDGSIPDENFKKCYRILKSEITSGTSTATFKNIPIGKYAVNILHDENKNGVIDKGFILPIEGIGFSNYETIGFSNRPSFEIASFLLYNDKTIKIKMIYL